MPLFPDGVIVKGKNLPPEHKHLSLRADPPPFEMGGKNENSIAASNENVPLYIKHIGTVLLYEDE